MTNKKNKFEVIDVKKDHNRILVEIEMVDSRERKQFGYPLNQGWETKIEDEYKFIRHIRQKLKEEEEINKQNIDFEEINKKVKGKKLNIE